MTDFIKKNKYLFIGVAVIVAGFIWFGFSEQQPSQGVLSSETVSGAGSAAERELLDTLLQLRSIQLDGQIFNDPSFRTLRDFSQEIVAEPIGRRNPFAPFQPIVTEEEEITEENGGDTTQ